MQTNAWHWLNPLNMNPTAQPITIGRPAPFAVVLLATLMPRFLPSKKELELQTAGFKENKMPFRAFYWDNDTRAYEEVGT